MPPRGHASAAARSRWFGVEKRPLGASADTAMPGAGGGRGSSAETGSAFHVLAGRVCLDVG